MAGLWLLLPGCMAHADRIVADGGSTDYKIVIDPKASASEQHAAAELQTFLEKICGARLSITQEAGAGPKIFVGPGLALERLSGGIELAGLGDEGFVIRTVGPHLVLAGGRPRGTLYACYEFLDRYLGCRWFTPKVSRIPARKTIRIPDIDDRKIPVFEYRDPYYAVALDGDWAARNRTNGWQARLGAKHGGRVVYRGFVHTFYSLVPPDEYFADHPEYYSQIEGKRTHEKAQLCLTNPDIAAIAADNVRQWLQEMPEADIVSVSHMDGYRECECDPCKTMTQREGSRAGPLIHFVNQVADLIRDDHPDVAIDTLAYTFSRTPPTSIRPRPNVIVRVCTGGCVSHPLGTCSDPKNHRYWQDLAGWSKLSDRVYVWDYVSNYNHYLLPLPNIHSFHPNIKYFLDHGVKGVFELGNYKGTGAFAELRSYILARCMWDPDCDWEQQMDEFLETYHGAAAGFIRQYIDLLSRKVLDEDIHVYIWDPPTSPAAPYLTSDIVARADRLFDRAQSAVADDPPRLRRVEKDRLPLQYVKLSRPKELFDSYEQFNEAVGEFARVAADWSIDRSNEGATLAPQLKKWRDTAAARRAAEAASGAE